MSDLDDTVDGPAADLGVPGMPLAGGGAEPDVAGRDAGGEVARRIRAVLRHGLDDAARPDA